MKKIFLSMLLLFIVLSIKAELKLPAIFGNNMMLQQNTEVKIWGSADKNQTITINP